MALEYKGTILNPIDRNTVEIIHNGFLEVDDSGRIANVGQDNDDNDLSQVIIPAFVDTHIHLPQFDVRGTFSGNELLPWLKTYIWPEEAKYSNTDHVTDVSKRFYDDLIRHGTLTAFIYGTVYEEATREMIDLMPIRGRVGKMIMDTNSPKALEEKTDEALKSVRKLCIDYDDRHIVTPRFAPSCTMDVMKGAAKIADDFDCYIQTHLSENEDEIAWVKKLFPNNKSYTDVYFQAGLLGPKTVVGHCVHCSDDELKILKQTGTKIAHCPTSNVALGSGTMPLDRIIEFDIPFALATDVGAGPKTSMLDVMRCFLDVHDSVNATPTSALYYATLAGAEILGYGNETGNFKKGKSADFLILDMQADKNKDADFIIRKLTHGSDYDTIVKKTFLKGVEQLIS
ncbi:amidohydrolase family protein [bacterium]|nr:amidohydrolase family protein [bacterium]